jgi:hypothetical protein
MPHDKNGAPLQVGDEVLIRAKVERIYPDAATCNGQFRTVETMTPDSSAGDLITINCHQVEKVDVVGPELDTVASDEEPIGQRLEALTETVNRLCLAMNGLATAVLGTKAMAESTSSGDPVPSTTETPEPEPVTT